MKPFNKTAYTFIEVMITMAIFVVMMGAVYSIFVLSQRSWSDYAENIYPRQETRRALVWMCKELREASGLFIVKDDHAVKLSFETPSGGHVEYVWQDSGEDAFRIMRKDINRKIILANRISLLGFRFDRDDEVYIEAVAGVKQKYGLKQKVALRSKTGLFAQSEHEKIK